MRINSIRLTNFRQHASTYIEFGDGLTGIIGPNGTGKSTILEAIAWALYGMQAARGTRESIKWNRAKERAQVRVELDFELGGHRYRVLRGLTSAELFLDGAAVPIANTVTSVSQVLRRRLGMKLDEFYHTYFTGQKELSVMAAMKPTERAQFLSQLLGYERLRVGQELARERKRTIVAEAAGVKTGMPDAAVVRKSAADAAQQLNAADAQVKTVEARRATATKAVATVTVPWLAVQEERLRLQSLDVEQRLAEGEQASGQRDFERQDRELAELATAQSELATLRQAIQPLADARRDLEAMDLLARAEGKRQTLVSNQRALLAEISKLRERRAQIETAPRLEEEGTVEIKKRQADFATASQSFDAAFTEWVKDKQEADTNVERLRQSLAEHKKQREVIVNEGEHGTCPICSRSLGDHYRTVLDAIDEQIDTLLVDGKYWGGRAHELVTMPPDVAALEARKKEVVEAIAKVEKRLIRIRSAVQELAILDADLVDRGVKLDAVIAEIAQVPSGYSVERHAMLRTRCDDLQTLESRAAKLVGALEREGQLRADRARVTSALAAVRIRLADLTTERANLRGVNERFEAARVAFEVATAQLRVADVEAASAFARHSSAVAASEAATRAVIDVDRAIARLDLLNRERRLHEELDRAYSDLRTDLNLQLRPDISNRASELLNELTGGRYSEFELDEKYDIVLHEDGRPRSVISGGEDDLANLVLRLAVSQKIAEGAGQPLSLLVLDEVFGSLDDERRENVVALLRGLHDRFDQVILITHIESVNEGLDHTVRVTYDDESGSSRIMPEEPASEIQQDELEMGAA